MPLPDITKHNTNPTYLRSLVELAGLSQRACAKAIGISDRQLRRYLSPNAYEEAAPYPVQFALEALADTAGPEVDYVVVEAPRLKRDYEGRTVRLTKDISNGFGDVLAGQIGTINSQGPKGSSITFERCGKCHSRYSVSAVRTGFEFIEEADSMNGEALL